MEEKKQITINLNDDIAEEVHSWAQFLAAQKRDPQRQAQSRNELSSKIASALRDSRT